MAWPRNARVGKKHTAAAKRRMSRAKIGTHHRLGKFKEDAKYYYQTVHNWMNAHLGKPRYCEHCKRSDKWAYDWANISGKYLRDLADWKRLCRSCHMKFDNVWDTRRRLYGSKGRS